MYKIELSIKVIKDARNEVMFITSNKYSSNKIYIKLYVTTYGLFRINMKIIFFDAKNNLSNQ